ncbi:PH domain-containing protein [Halobaculum sp. CBA1158]|uniref:PH domain-containing protein n=1 Tax=Halobaculum sp. CBA1158 TaxID=2904243 RepID=UPI001F438F91|nr:PH domain-containing protein [Halobaculum sp. CBA1158]UIO98755.1 PH domain-containing protein [Halobaculum sp. CBA1158]
MVRLHPYSAAIQAAFAGGRLALFAVFVSTAFAGMGDGPVGLAAAGALVPAAFLVGAGASLARWYRFEYEVLPEHLLVRSGVLARQEREIPLRRVQNVDLSRSVLQRAFGLATVAVETAGGGSTEATLDAVSLEDARRLREELSQRGRRARDSGDFGGEADPAGATTDRAGDEGGAPAGGVASAGATPTAAASAGDAETLYELTGLRFATLCAISFRPSAVIAPFVGASLFDDVLFDIGQLLVRLGVVEVDVGPGDVPSLGTAEFLWFSALAVVAFLLVVWVVSAAITFVRYYGFRLERVGDELRYERGLLGRYSGTAPLSKVQTITVSENIAMRRLGYASLAVDTAGYAPGGNGDDGGIETAVPLDTRERVVALADDVREELDRRPRAGSGSEAPRADAFGTDAVERPPGRARNRYVVRYVFAALAVAGVVFGVDRLAYALPDPLVALAFAGVALAPLAGHLTWANRGHATVDDGFVARTGTIRRHTRLVPYFRLQTVFVSRSPFQRRRDLASVVADTASSSGVLGGDAVAHDADADAAGDLRDELLDRLQADLAERRRLRDDRESDDGDGGGDGGDGDGDTERFAEGDRPGQSEVDPGERDGRGPAGGSKTEE